MIFYKEGGSECFYGISPELCQGSGPNFTALISSAGRKIGRRKKHGTWFRSGFANACRGTETMQPIKPWNTHPLSVPSSRELYRGADGKSAFKVYFCDIVRPQGAGSDRSGRSAGWRRRISLQARSAKESASATSILARHEEFSASGRRPRRTATSAAGAPRAASCSSWRAATVTWSSACSRRRRLWCSFSRAGPRRSRSEEYLGRGARCRLADCNGTTSWRSIGQAARKPLQAPRVRSCSEVCSHEIQNSSAGYLGSRGRPACRCGGTLKLEIVG